MVNNISIYINNQSPFYIRRHAAFSPDGHWQDYDEGVQPGENRLVGLLTAQEPYNDLSGLCLANIHSEEYQMYLDCTLAVDVRAGTKAGISETANNADANTFYTLIQNGDQNAQYNAPAGGVVQVQSYLDNSEEPLKAIFTFYYH